MGGWEHGRVGLGWVGAWEGRRAGVGGSMGREGGWVGAWEARVGRRVVVGVCGW